ncbi:hypothetical protein HH800_05900 [Sphingobium yanoikuyae]|uniref:Uncharacterized protein n=1 Tax=Sphingobium yanoikuyae TaxID=13690 RepID=A0A6M4G4D4_SPHYA|nr:hypothetical protein [Sphingobium yanoikuyae]QJR01770.1 hypothetical protein HH800_05900 [Sphingobium yanoikuyae]
MTDRDTLLALAERVEALSNPNAEIDGDIVMALGLLNFDTHRLLLFADGQMAPAISPAYTASLDAAKTLVPKGWHVGMLTECDEDDSPSCCLTQNEEPCRDAVGRGADMALSLVAASLRARAGGL